LPSLVSPRPESEWIAVPVPESGIPREWVDAAREAIADNVKFSQNDNRPWELSGGIARCGVCGWAMRAHTVGSGNGYGKINHYYRCSRVNINYAYKACSNRKIHRADRLEPLVWDYVSGVMKNPEQLRADLDRMIELERGRAATATPIRKRSCGPRGSPRWTASGRATRRWPRRI
jgi:site-specific DNA recombinase